MHVSNTTQATNNNQLRSTNPNSSWTNLSAKESSAMFIVSDNYGSQASVEHFNIPLINLLAWYQEEALVNLSHLWTIQIWNHTSGYLQKEPCQPAFTPLQDSWVMPLRHSHDSIHKSQWLLYYLIDINKRINFVLCITSKSCIRPRYIKLV